MNKVDKTKSNPVKKFTLKKVDVDNYVPPNVTVSDDELKLEALEHELEELNSKKQEEKTPPNLKPQKRPSTKRVVSGDVIMFERWTPIVKQWAESKNLKVDLEVGKIADRVDVMGEGFRIVVMASYDNEFTMTLFYNYDLGFNSRCINVEYVKIDAIQIALEFLLGGQSLFKFNEEEGTNTNERTRD